MCGMIHKARIGFAFRYSSPEQPLTSFFCDVSNTPMQYKNRPARCLDPGFVFCLPTVFCLSTSIRSTFGSAVSQTYRTSESDLPWLFLFQPAGPSDIRSHPQYLLPSIF